jgi:acyl transferase domain-containing protein/acyl carrier protein
MTHECLSEDEVDGVLIAASLRKRRPEARAFLDFLAQAHANGVDVDWNSFFDEQSARRVSLPTYAFQRRRYWLSSGTGVTDASSLGQSSAEHPLLGAALHLAGEEDGWLFTGRLSTETHPWLKDHAIMDSVLMPGTGLLELALAAGQRVGSEMVEELMLQAPLLLTDDGAVQLQVTVSEPDAEGRRQFEIYSRSQQQAEDEFESGEWTRHASGVLCSGEGMHGFELEEVRNGGQWPPPGAEELDIEFFYDRLAEVGYGYGPAFRGLRRVFGLGDELFAEVALEEERASEAQSFCVHPALSDAAQHAALLGGDQATELGVPFAFSGVRLFGGGAGAVRVRLTRDGETLSVFATDGRGDPVFSVQSLQMRTVDQSQLRAIGDTSHDSLYRLEWVEVPSASANGSRPHVAVIGSGERIQAPGIEMESHEDLAALEDAIEQGSATPEVVLVEAAGMMREASEGETSQGGGDGRDLASTIHQTTRRTLELLQAWIASERLPETRLVLVTDGAVAAGRDAATDGEVPNLAQAALVGLVRSAQSEHPGRFGTIDLDEEEASRGVSSLYDALALAEPELAVRQGVLYAPRFARVKAGGDDPAESSDSHGTVLITGGTGGLGALVARHLAADRRAERLLLVSRRGLEAEGATELLDELGELGCQARIAACDVADRAQLQELLAAIPEECPLTAVVHTAGVLDDGLIESLDGERLARVLTPKVDAAINLHELTEHAGLREFVLFSSAAASVGSPGQGNYAAANAFLDALGAYRRAKGLPGVSLAWGAWDRATGMAGALSESDRARLHRVGIFPLSDDQGLELFDLARGIDEPMLLPVRLDMALLRAHAKAGMLPAVLRGLIRTPTRQASDAGDSLAKRLGSAPQSEWDGIVLELVRSHVAGALGHASSEAVDPRRAFKELGFDSLAAVELRNRLGQATGLKLPATLVFDHPTSAAVADYVRVRVEGAAAARSPVDEQVDKLEAALASIAEDETARKRADARLRVLNARLRSFLSGANRGSAGEDQPADEDLDQVSDDELFEIIEKEFGTS